MHGLISLSDEILRPQYLGTNAPIDHEAFLSIWCSRCWVQLNICGVTESQFSTEYHVARRPKLRCGNKGRCSFPELTSPVARQHSVRVCVTVNSGLCLLTSLSNVSLQLEAWSHSVW